ncbi:hypothetical protein I306_03572 [Cryptococcus gattii EJB2]|uniref:Uncharacterized protein n=1 Tax=Cryptococcus gattii EJB2 TaxID=1296103 RepID=A0ABR5BUY7_9TREE|nr:hypothetical protein I306_03572 [Cryptococcus gattii EJB2]
MTSNYYIVPVAVMYTAYTSTLCCKLRPQPELLWFRDFNLILMKRVSKLIDELVVIRNLQEHPL